MPHVQDLTCSVGRSGPRPMGVSEPLLYHLELLRKDGSRVRFEYSLQMFYGAKAQVAY